MKNKLGAVWSEAKCIDWVLVLAVTALCLFGLMMIHSTTLGLGFNFADDPLLFLRNQMRAAFIGIALAAILASMRLDWLQSLALPLILLSVFMLTFVLVVSQGVFGPARFLFGGSYQPAILAKLTVLLYVTVWVSSRGRQRIKVLDQGLIPFSIIVGLVTFLIVLQPDLTTSFLLILAAFSLYFVAGATWQHFAVSGLIGTAVFVLFLVSLPYAQVRLTDWAATVRQPTAGPYQIQAVVAAINNGGIWGQGYRLGQVKAILPISHADSIYAVVCEEFGLIGGVLLAALILFVALRGIMIARRSESYFGCLLAYGVSALLLWQTLINIGVMTAIFPFSGLSLPYISYGGSDLVIQFGMVGLLLSVARQNNKEKASDPSGGEEMAGRRKSILATGSFWLAVLICISVLLLGLLVYRNTQAVNRFPLPDLEDAFGLLSASAAGPFSFSFIASRFIVLGFGAVFLYSLFDMRLHAARFDQDWVASIEENLAETGGVKADSLGRNGAVLLAAYYERHPERDLVLQNKTTLRYARYDLQQNLRAVWRMIDFAHESNGVVSQGIAAVAMELLSGMLASPIQPFAGELPDSAYHVFLLDTYNLFSSLRLPRQMLVFMPAREQLTENEWMSIPGLTRQVSGKVDIAILLAWSSKHRSATALARLRQVLAFDIVFVDEAEMSTLAIHRNRQDLFRRLILQAINLHTISPFVTAGTTPETMFVGREKEIREVVEHATSTNYVIVGGRRIGKTSLLRRLHGIRLPAADVRAVYQDCTIITSYDAFLATPLRDWKPAPPPQAPATFGDLLKMPELDQPLVLLLDEADKIVNLDRPQGWPILEALRALTNSSNVKVVFCGERVLLGALQDSSGPLFNLADPIRLGPLDFPSVAELIVRPMAQLGIRLHPEDEIVKRIWTITSGHPNLVQRLCSRLIDRLLLERPDGKVDKPSAAGTTPGQEAVGDGFQWREMASRAISFLLPDSRGLAAANRIPETRSLESSLARTITLADVETVAQAPSFLRDDLLETYWGSATTLEKIVSLLMAENQQINTLAAVRNALAERCNLDVSLREVDASLQWLVDLRLILNRTAGGYQFRATAFPMIIARTLTLDDTLAVQIEEYREQQ